MQIPTIPVSRIKLSAAAAAAASGVLLMSVLCIATPARAATQQEGAPRTERTTDTTPRMQLSADAERRVPNDKMMVVLASEKNGADAAALNRQVLDELNAAMNAAKQNGNVKARLGNLGTQPEWSEKGKRTGWRVRGEIVIEGNDMAAVADLAAKAGQTLQFDRVSFDLTDETRKRAQEELTKEAIEAFRDRAAKASRHFGFNDYSIHRVQVGLAGQNHRPQPYQDRAVRSMSSSSYGGAPSVPTDGGETEVRVTVSGEVNLK